MAVLEVSGVMTSLYDIKTVLPQTRVMVHGILPGLDLEEEQVSAVSSCLKKAAKHCKELFLESPERGRGVEFGKTRIQY